MTYLRHIQRELHRDADAADIEHAAGTPLQAEYADSERVVIGYSNENVVALSRVNDYLYRPVVMENWSLHDFLARADVKRVTARRKRDKGAEARDCAAEVSLEDNEEDQTLIEDDVVEFGEDIAPEPEPEAHRETGASGNAPRDHQSDLARGFAGYFVEPHPNHATHGCHLLPISHRPYTLNFVGGALPRPDKGDRELYCLTMLILFYPTGWRTAKQLRGTANSWSEVFQNTTFSEKHIQIMKNLNVLNECKDARDDFAAQRRAEQVEDLNLPVFNVDRDFQAGDPFFDDFDTEPLGNIDYSDESLYGKQTLHRIEEMGRMRSLLASVRYSDVSHTAPHSHGHSTTLLRSSKSASEWKTVVTNAKELVMQAKIANRPSRQIGQSKHFVPGDVAVISLSDLSLFYNKDIPRSQQDPAVRMVHDTVADFTLNPEQERAFIIVAEALHHRERPPLRMYLGGEGGTGKSTVFNAITSFLRRRNEAYRFLIMAPTGSAAANVDGSTYHSVLGFTRQHQTSNRTALAKVRGRIEDPDVYLYDEMSMISANEVYRISAQKCAALDCPDYSFGGKSVIFCGDFAQLPPPGAGQASLYSATLGPWSDGLTVHSQQAVIGKALWHTFTTVVILRQNMRQTGQSDGDKKLRGMLHRIRYRQCIEEDFSLLDSRTIGKGLPLDTFADTAVRNVSIITARNAHRDATNELGTVRFALETGQVLHAFHSIDHWASNSTTHDSVRQAQRTADSTTDPLRRSDEIPSNVRDVLWSIPPTASDHHAGVLLLCKDLPVLLKHNFATELCATNGAEATVVGWDSSRHPDGEHEILDTLFVSLTNPPRPTQLPDLPLNVIPLPRTKEKIQTIMPDDTRLRIVREQVPVLPNFAMSDFSSQGRTRHPANVVDLTYCRNNQSVYVALSRTTTLEGTYIIGTYDRSKLTGGLPGALRREFRELEILDDITRLRCEGRLPWTVTGTTRATLINTYQRWKGPHYTPPHVSPFLNWAREPAESLAPPAEPRPWSLLNARESKKRKSAPSSSASQAKRTHTDRATGNVAPQVRATVNVAPQESNSITGMRWDAGNWSCAYDALFTVVFSLYRVHPTHDLFNMNHIMSQLARDFRSSLMGMRRLEDARDRARDALYGMNPDGCPRYGAVPSSLSDVVQLSLKSEQTLGSIQTVCQSCGASNTSLNDDLSDTLLCAYPQTEQNPMFADSLPISSQTELDRTLNSPCSRCSSCRSPSLRRTHIFTRPPTVLALEVFPEHYMYRDIIVDRNITVSSENGAITLRLLGVLYSGDNHFTCRFIDPEGYCWYHDGIATGQACAAEGVVDDMNLLQAFNRKAHILLYIK